MKSDRIGFGGGCHWCTEAVFVALKGVKKVEQGFISSLVPNDSFSEAVIVSFDPEKIDLAILIEIHLRTHASTSDHSMRGKYRSAIYTFDDMQLLAAKTDIERLQSDFGKTIVTEVMPFVQFKSSDERFHNYYGTDPTRPFCTAYIDPKLKLIRERFSTNVHASG